MNVPYYYIVEDHDERLEDATRFVSSWDSTNKDQCGWIAEDAAQHEFDYCDGWEATWPLTFAIYDEGKQPLGRFLVEQEARPVFTAEAKS